MTAIHDGRTVMYNGIKRWIKIYLHVSMLYPGI
jgi:hypothetical protein